MTTTRSDSRLQGLHRPGRPFTAEELQLMAHDGVLRCAMPGVYAETHLGNTRSLRARAASAVLSPSLRPRSVLCGETAAWVHVDSTPPESVMVITEDFYRRPNKTYGPWQIHQMPLSAPERLKLSGVAVTSARRTAADLFLGVGVTGRPKSLHLLESSSERIRRTMVYWPRGGGQRTGLEGQRVSETKHRDAEYRMHLISRLMTAGRFSVDELVAEIEPRIPNDRSDRTAIRRMMSNLQTQSV